MRNTSRCLLIASLLPLIVTSAAWAKRSVTFTTVAQGNRSGITAHIEVVARTSDEWKEIWRKHTVGGSPPVPPPVDFSRNMVIAIFFGKVPVGQRTAIHNIVEENNRLVVLFQMIGPPGPESEEVPHMTPFHIVQVPRSALPVVFVREKIPDIYQPGR